MKLIDKYHEILHPLAVHSRSNLTGQFMKAWNLIKIKLYWTEISNHPLPLSSGTPVAPLGARWGAVGRGGQRMW